MNKEDYELIIEMLAKKVNKLTKKVNNLQQTEQFLRKEIDELSQSPY
jgi:cell division protein FtsB